MCGMTDTGTGAVRFTVQYDDMYCMGLWCWACLDAGLQGEANLLRNEPENRWDTDWPLERFNELAGAHKQAAHPDAPG